MDLNMFFEILLEVDMLKSVYYNNSMMFVSVYSHWSGWRADQ